MNISPHLLIDAVILSIALTITLVLRAKGNAARKERESKWNPHHKNINIYKLLELIIFFKVKRIITLFPKIWYELKD